MYESMIAQSMLTTISAEISKTKGRRQDCRKVIFPYDVVQLRGRRFETRPRY